MRISDWSSDVCSSDLRGRFLELLEARHPLHRDADRDAERDEDDDREAEAPAKGAAQRQAPARRRAAGDRQGLVWGKRVSVRVDLGGVRISKNETETNNRR